MVLLRRAAALHASKQLCRPPGTVLKQYRAAAPAEGSLLCAGVGPAWHLLLLVRGRQELASMVGTALPHCHPLVQAKPNPVPVLPHCVQALHGPADLQPQVLALA